MLIKSRNPFLMNQWKEKGKVNYHIANLNKNYQFFLTLQIFKSIFVLLGLFRIQKKPKNIKRFWNFIFLHIGKGYWAIIKPCET